MVARRSHALLLGLVAALALGMSGCRTTKEDVGRWANTAQGPRKLVAVLTHDKYLLELRLEAALTLVRMKPRGGRRVGIQGTDEQPGLIDTLSAMPPNERAKIVNRLVPQLEAEMLRPPPKAQAGTAAPPDPSYPFKDAAFALLTHDGGSLLPEEENRRRLRAALSTWAVADFTTRMDESSQMFGMEQVLRELKADGVRQLPDLITPGAKKIDRISDLTAELGDPETKLRASNKLVEIARHTTSPRWKEEVAPSVQAMNEASKLKPTPEQFKLQLDAYQEEEVLRVFSSMKKVGQRPSVDFLMAFATRHQAARKAARSCPGGVEGNLDKNDAKTVDGLIAIASGKDEPDAVRDVALRRLGDFPRKLVVDKLYTLFTHDMWQVRWIAAELVLKMSDTSHIDEFMRQLARAEGMAISEPLMLRPAPGRNEGSKEARGNRRQVFRRRPPGAGSTHRARVLLPRRHQRAALEGRQLCPGQAESPAVQGGCA